MATRKEINKLIKKYIPATPIIGKGVTIKSLRQKLIDANVIDDDYNLILVNEPKQRHSSSSKKASPKKNENLFPYGPGFEQIDINILASMPDNDLANACRSNSYLSNLCNDNEFWRLKFSAALGFDVKIVSPGTTIIYKDLYKKYKPAFDQPPIIAFYAIEDCYYDIFIRFYLNIDVDNIVEIIYACLYCEDLRFLEKILESVEVTDEEAYVALENSLEVNFTHGDVYPNIAVPILLIKEKIVTLDNSLLENAIRNGDVPILEVLLDKDKKHGDSLFITITNRLCEAIKSQKLEMVKYILENWGTNVQDYTKELQCAMKNKNTKITKYLFSVNKSPLTKVEITELLKIAINSHSLAQIMYLVVKYGKKAISKPHQIKILHLIAKFGTLNDFMLVAGENYVTSGEEYEYLFSETVRGNNPKIAQYLLQNLDKHVKKEDREEIEHHTKYTTYLVRRNFSSVARLGHHELVEIMSEYVDISKYTNDLKGAIREMLSTENNLSVDEKESKLRVENYFETVKVFLKHGVSLPDEIKRLCSL